MVVVGWMIAGGGEKVLLMDVGGKAVREVMAADKIMRRMGGGWCLLAPEFFKL